MMIKDSEKDFHTPEKIVKSLSSSSYSNTAAPAHLAFCIDESISPFTSPIPIRKNSEATSDQRKMSDLELIDEDL